jgi:hypothetical protein
MRVQDIPPSMKETVNSELYRTCSYNTPPEEKWIEKIKSVKRPFIDSTKVKDCSLLKNLY